VSELIKCLLNCLGQIQCAKCPNVCPEIGAFSTHLQARNQLWTLQGAKSFLRGAQCFYTMSSSFKVRPTPFSKGGFALVVTVLSTWGQLL